jgi:hypothetical protein
MTGDYLPSVRLLGRSLGTAGELLRGMFRSPPDQPLPVAGRAGGGRTAAGGGVGEGG